jgi:hypothetical protein
VKRKSPRPTTTMGPAEKSRGDRTAIELFLVGLVGWSDEIRHALSTASPRFPLQDLCNSTASQARA